MFFLTVAKILIFLLFFLVFPEDFEHISSWIKSLWQCVVFSYERTPMDEAVSRGKMDVVDAINTAVAQVELTGINVS